jgi:TP901 family phage tail tape measure protein
MAISKDSLEYQIKVNSNHAKKSIDELGKSIDDAGVTIKKADAALKNMSADAMAKAAKQAENLSTKFHQIATPGMLDNLKMAFKDVGDTMVRMNQGIELFTRGFYFLQNSADKTVGAFADFERQLALIKTVMTDSEIASVDLNAEISNLYKTFGGSLPDITKAYYDLLASGVIKSADATMFLTTAQKLSVGGATSLTDSIGILTSFIAAYGLTAQDTARISDILFIGAAEGKTSIQELAQQMGVALKTADNLGVSMEEIVSAVSAVTTNGISTAESVTSVASAMQALMNPTKDLELLFKRLGINSIQNQVATNGLSETLKLLVGNTDKTIESFTRLFQRKEANAAILSLTGDTKLLTGMMNNMEAAANNVGSVTEKAFKKMADTASFQFGQTSAQIKMFFIQLGQIATVSVAPLAKALMDVVQGMNDSLTKMTQASGGIENFNKNILSLVSSIGLVSTAFLLFFSKYNVAIVLSIANTKAFMVSLMGAAAPVAIFITLAVVLENVFNNFSLLGDMFDIVLAKLYKLINGFDTLVTKMKLKEATSGLFEKDQDNINNLQNKLKSLAQDTKNYTAILEESKKKVSAKTWDFGSVGVIMGGIFKKASDETKKLETATAGIISAQTKSNELKQISARFTEEEINKSKSLFEQLMSQNKSLMEQASFIGLSTEKQNVIKLQSRLQELATLKETLKAQDQLYGKEQQINSAIADTNKLLLIAKDAAAINVSGFNEDDYSKAMEGIKQIITGWETAGLTEEQIQIRSLSLREDQLKLMELQLMEQLITIDNAEKLLQINEKLAAVRSSMPVIAEKKRQIEESDREDPVKMYEDAAKAAKAAAEATKAANIDAAMGTMQAIEGGTNSVITKIGSAFGPEGQLVAGVIVFFNKTKEQMRDQIDGLMTGLAQVIPNIAASIPQFIASFLNGIPKIIDGIVAGLESLIALALNPSFWVDILDGLWKAFKSVIRGIVKFLKDLFTLKMFFGDSKDAEKAIIDPIKKAIKSMTGVTSQVFGYVGENLGAMAGGTAQALADTIARATKQSVSWLTAAWEALKQAGRWVAGIFIACWDALKAIGEGVGNFIVALFAASWELLKLIGSSIVAAFVGCWDILKAVGTAVVQIFTDAWTFLKFIGEGVAAVFVAAWEVLKVIGGAIALLFISVWEVLKAIGTATVGLFTDAWDALTFVGTAVVALFTGAWDGLKAVGQWIIDTVWTPFSNIVSDAFKWVVDNIFTPFSAIVSAPFEALKTMFLTDIPNAFSGMFTGLKNAVVGLFTFDWVKMKEGFNTIFASVGDFLLAPIRSIFNPMIDLLNGIVIPAVNFDIPKPWGGSWGIHMWDAIDMIPGDIARLASGGLVPNMPSFAGAGFGTDTVSAALTPGEFVINRQAVQNLGAPLLNQLNRGQAPRGATTNNIYLSIKTEQPIDEHFIKSKLMPEIEKSLKKSSLEGKRLLSVRGVQ